MSKFKHTVEIETDFEVQHVSVIMHNARMKAKIIKTEEIKPPVLPLKVGDRLRRINTEGEFVTVIHRALNRWVLEWDDGAIGGWTEDQITNQFERVP